jgi:SAM-dependent methyltransferase
MNASFKDSAVVWMIEEYKKHTPASVGAPIRMIELGCGIPLYMKSILATYPEVSFVGVEPYQKSYDHAMQEFAGEDRVRIIHGDGTRVDLPDASFDIVFSLSVLEHVKFLERFLAESVRVGRSGALIVHRYDHGHALYPSSLKERMQVFLCNRFPSIVPIDKFACYVNEERARALLATYGAPVYKSTYHQMPNHKTLEKKLHHQATAHDFLEAMITWERDISPELSSMETLDRERLFPAVAVWARKA